MVQSIFWKVEENNRRWNWIPDTESARNIAIKQGAMFFTWMSFSASPGKNNGQPEPIRIGDMPLDFDSEKNPGAALQDLKTLCLIHLPEFYEIDPYEIKFYCSGKKGFHAIIPKEVFGMEQGDPYLPLIYKKILGDWGERFNIKTLDHSLYAMGKGKMFRIENVKRKNGRYKVPVTLEEIRDMPIDELLNLTRSPRHA